MSEGSSRSSQEGLDGSLGDGKQQTTLQRTQTTPSITEYRPHPPVTRVCTNPHVETGRPRLQLNINPYVTSQVNNTQGVQRASGHGVNLTSRSQSAVNTGDGAPAMLNDTRSPPPYNSNHRLASSPQLAPAQRTHLQGGRPAAGQSNSASTTEAQMVPQSPEWQDWQRDRWQIWQLLSSDNADTLPETLVWSHTVDSSQLFWPN